VGTSPEIKFKDYYKILGLDKNSSQEEIKKTFRLLARKYHPDATENNKTLETKFKDLFEAYEVLSDSEKRSTYDKFLEEYSKKGITARLDGEVKKKDNASFSDFFYSMFGSVKDNTLKNIKKINHIEKNITITIEEAYNGTKKEVLLPNEENCRKCEGHGTVKGVTCVNCKGKGVIHNSRPLTVKIPPNVTNNSKLCIKGEGYGSGVLKGDLYLNVTLEKHSFFEILENNSDISSEIPITVTEAIMGTDIEVPTLKNSVKMKVPPGTQPGQTFRLKGRGMYNKKEENFGDQYVHIHVVIPKNLTNREKELYHELSLIERLSPREHLYN
jgi:DnaJ-class molecular chaperone